MIDVTNWEFNIKEHYGGAEGIYALHCLSPRQCPCQNFHECIGVYKLLEWDTWMEWRKENCVVRKSPIRWLRDGILLTTLASNSIAEARNKQVVEILR